ncbi:hypothetical protein NJB93_19630 [Brucella intermedia]|uniref:hypothetical protein n=1 Tax=Brucella intermedia TaxID=94625 RepID=UPI00209AE383|nr:hypothetical protein [Brucella intermedia]MCO7728794.1 hypothetical protein [Brucella intermedia]
MSMHGTMLANASAADRNAYDFYATPWEATQALLNFFNITGCTVWEPACGDGDMAKIIRSNGNIVIATELRDTGYGLPGVDFLTCSVPENVDWIITNPPFNLSVEFIERCLEHGKKFALLLKSQYWHSKKRLSLFEKHAPSHVLPLTWRPDFHHGLKGGSPTMEVAWTVWDAVPSNVTAYYPLKKPSAIRATHPSGGDRHGE